MKLKQFNFKKVQSTNQTAIRLIKSSKNEFGLIVSEAQSKGRGQYGRKWISNKGNIFLSFFYKLENIKISFSSLTKKNCFLVKDVISKYYNKKISFKSPNDLLINKKKISGILQETISISGNKFLVVGIGVNLNKSPEIPNYPTISLFELTGKNINKGSFEKTLKVLFEKNLSRLYKITNKK